MQLMKEIQLCSCITVTLSLMLVAIGLLFAVFGRSPGDSEQLGEKGRKLRERGWPVRTAIG